LEEVTCLKFVAYDPTIHTDFITVIGSGSGCYSSVGRRGREQFLNLQPYARESGCFRLYTIVHEFIHAIGFYHMQSAPERDDFVRIELSLVQQGSAHNFNKYGFETVTNYDVEYDYGSVMHYSKTAFSINGSDTIIPLRDLNGDVMGQRLRMSNKDIARVNRMYCDEPETTTWPIESTTWPVESTTGVVTSRPPPVIIPKIPELVRSIHAWAKNLLGNILGSIRQ
jgi:Astacin (Peptidase family M12A)